MNHVVVITAVNSVFPLIAFIISSRTVSLGFVWQQQHSGTAWLWVPLCAVSIDKLEEINIRGIAMVMQRETESSAPAKTPRVCLPVWQQIVSPSTGNHATSRSVSVQFPSNTRGEPAAGTGSFSSAQMQTTKGSFKSKGCVCAQASLSSHRH